MQIPRNELAFKFQAHNVNEPKRNI